jgi:hypothetical protein
MFACVAISWYEFFDRRRSMRINQRLLAYVRQLEQARVYCVFAFVRRRCGMLT